MRPTLTASGIEAISLIALSRGRCTTIESHSLYLFAIYSFEDRSECRLPVRASIKRATRSVKDILVQMLSNCYFHPSVAGKERSEARVLRYPFLGMPVKKGKPSIYHVPPEPNP